MVESAPALQITMELLRDIERSLRSILSQDFGVPLSAIEAVLRETPPSLSLSINRENLHPAMRRDPKILTEIMAQVGTSTRAAIDASFPSLSHGLGMRYVPLTATLEFGVGPDTSPIYPHIITGRVDHWRLTDAGVRHLREQNKRGAL